MSRDLGVSAANQSAIADSLNIAAPIVEIRPPGRWGVGGFREIWEYRELLYFLGKRELQIRYKQSVLGVAWAVFQPLALALIFTLIFGRLAQIPSNGVPYVLFVLTALVLWTFNAQAVTACSSSLVADANLLSKVFFPRALIPAAKTVALLVDAVIGTVLVFVFMAFYGFSPEPTLLLAPLFALLAVVTALGIGLFLAALNVKYRDVTLITPLFVQIWFFITPVVYPATLIPANLDFLYAINPIATAVQGFRWALLGTPGPTLGTAAISSFCALLLLAGGYVYFRKTERFFADIV